MLSADKSFPFFIYNFDLNKISADKMSAQIIYAAEYFPDKIGKF